MMPPGKLEQFLPENCGTSTVLVWPGLQDVAMDT